MVRSPEVEVGRSPISELSSAAGNLLSAVTAGQRSSGGPGYFFVAMTICYNPHHPPMQTTIKLAPQMIRIHPVETCSKQLTGSSNHFTFVPEA